MAADYKTILQDICGLLEPFNKKGIDLTEAVDITADLNIDSVAVLDLIMTVEDTYDISIPINLLSDVHTIGELSETVRTVIAGK